MINTVIFDLGGVLVHFHPRQGIEALGFPPEVVDVFMANIFSGLWEACDKEDYDLATIKQVFKAHVPGYEAYVDLMWADKNIQKVTAVFDYSYQWLKSLKDRGFKIYVLSNFGRVAFTVNSELYTFLELTDGRVVSYEVQEVKPARPIYDILLDKYDIKPDQAVFIDDRPENIETARSLGLGGIVFTSYDQASSELETLISRK